MQQFRRRPSHNRLQSIKFLYIKALREITGIATVTLMLALVCLKQLQKFK